MLFRHSISIAQQLLPIYNTTVHRNKVNVDLKSGGVMCPILNPSDVRRHWGRGGRGVGEVQVTENRAKLLFLNKQTPTKPSIEYQKDMCRFTLGLSTLCL